MRPSSRQIIESIQWELDTHVAPEVHSDWAQSSLRSIGSLLVHLAARVDLEVDLLIADNADLRSLLAELVPVLGSVIIAIPDKARSSALPALVEENELMRQQLDEALAALLDIGAEDAVAKVTSYLHRQLERERPLVELRVHEAPLLSLRRADRAAEAVSGAG